MRWREREAEQRQRKDWNLWGILWTCGLIYYETCSLPAASLLHQVHWSMHIGLSAVQNMFRWWVETSCSVSTVAKVQLIGIFLVHAAVPQIGDWPLSGLSPKVAGTGTVHCVIKSFFFPLQAIKIVSIPNHFCDL